jgi:hypothetical protein
MADDRLQRRAEELTARVDALAAALRESGVPDETSARLLSHASAAVLQALTLELVLDEPSAPRSRASAGRGLRTTESSVPSGERTGVHTLFSAAA